MELRRVFAVIVALALAAPTLVRAQEEGSKLRHCALFDEYFDGAKQDSSAAEAQLTEALIERGIVFIDEAQARKIRSVTDAGTLIGGQVSEVITSLDADVIIAGICKVTLIAKGVMGQPLVRYDADIQAKVIAVDTGEVLGAFSVRGEAMDFNETQAGMKAARTAAALLTEKVVAAIAKKSSGPQRIEVTIAGMTNVMAVETVRKTLSAAEGVKSVQVLQAGRGMSKLAVEIAGMTSGQLAVALQSIPELGLEVWGYSERAIKADYNPAAALDLPLIVARFENKTGSRRHDWAASALAEVFQIELADCQFLQQVTQDGPVSAGAADKAVLSALAKEYKVDAGKTLVATGSYAMEKDKIRMEARIIVAGSGSVLRSGQVVCEPEQLSECSVKVAQEFAAGLLQDITGKAKLFGAGISKQSLQLAAEGGGARKPLEVVKVEVENIFPSRLGRYAGQPVGTVSLKNAGEEELVNLSVAVQLAGFMGAALESQHGSLAPGATVDLPVKLVLDAKALGALDENRPAMLNLGFSYRLGEFQVDQTTTRSVMVFDRNSLTWAEPQSLATFVTAKEESVQAVAGLVATDQVTPALRSHALFYASQFHELLRQGGLKYVSDAVNPYGEEQLDYVQFPVETLARGAGDCDDLAVLFATLIESVGKEAALVLTPGHVLVAVNTGVPFQDGQQIAVDEELLMAVDGTAWIPLETTLTTVPFADAWTAGAKQVAQWRGSPEKVTLVRVRQAWQAWPPVNLASAAVELERWRTGAATLKAAEVLEAHDKARLAAFEARLAAIDAEIAKSGKPTSAQLKAKGLLLAREGRMADAAKIFDQCAKAGDEVAAWNNLGNLRAREGKVDESLSLYKQAIGKAPKDARLHANAGMVYFLKNDADAALEHFVACIDLGAEEEIARLGELGLGAGGAKGAEGGGAATAPLLTELALKAFKKSGKEPRKGLKEAGERKASEGGTGGSDQLYRFLYWL